MMLHASILLAIGTTQCLASRSDTSSIGPAEDTSSSSGEATSRTRTYRTFGEVCAEFAGCCAPLCYLFARPGDALRHAVIASLPEQPEPVYIDPYNRVRQRGAGRRRKKRQNPCDATHIQFEFFDNSEGRKRRVTIPIPTHEMGVDEGVTNPMYVPDISCPGRTQRLSGNKYWEEYKYEGEPRKFPHRSFTYRVYVTDCVIETEMKAGWVSPAKYVRSTMRLSWNYIMNADKSAYVTMEVHVNEGGQQFAFGGALSGMKYDRQNGRFLVWHGHEYPSQKGAVFDDLREFHGCLLNDARNGNETEACLKYMTKNDKKNGPELKDSVSIKPACSDVERSRKYMRKLRAGVEL